MESFISRYFSFHIFKLLEGYKESIGTDGAVDTLLYALKAHEFNPKVQINSLTALWNLSKEGDILSISIHL